MNAAEWITYVLACGASTAYFLRRFRSLRTATALLVVYLAPIYLALESTSQFITADENHYLHQLCTPARSSIVGGDMANGAFQTTLAALSPLLLQMPDSTEWPNVTAIVVLKLSHWLLGFAAFLWLLHRIVGLVPPEHGRPTTALGAALLIFPQTQIALKTFNYDALSMLLGIVAALYLTTALRYRDRGAARWAVVAAAFAAQEKLIASPILTAAVGVAAAVGTAEPLRLRQLLAGVIRALGLAAAVSASTVVILKTTFAPTTIAWSQLPQLCVQPAAIWSWGVMRFTLGITEFSKYWPLLLGLNLLLCLGGAWLIAAALSSRAAGLRRRAVGLVAPFMVVAVPSVVVLGAAADHFVQPYWHPFFPIGAERYRPPGAMNGVILHFDAATIGEHLLASVGYAYAVFVDSVPTVFWVLAACLILTRKGRAGLSEQSSATALLAVSLCAPLLYGLMQVMVGHRYLNLFLGLAAASLIVLTAAQTAFSSVRVRWAAAVVAVSAAVVEVVPFQPFAATFRPIWVEYADAHHPRPGIMNPSWVGWGEEMLSAGRMIEAASPGTPFTLYCCYYSGAWATRNPDVRQVLILALNGDRPAQFGEHDYFVINRSMVVQGMTLPPIAPDYVVSARGFDWAWVYQGKRLAEAGIGYDYDADRFTQLTNLGDATTAAKPVLKDVK